jgi:hypothetical protein
MYTKETALKRVKELNLINIIKNLIGSSDEIIIDYDKTKTITLTTHTLNYGLASIKTFDVLITKSFLRHKDVLPEVVLSFYDNTVTTFRYGPWVNFIVNFYKTILKKDEEDNKKAWEPTEL